MAEPEQKVEEAANGKVPGTDPEVKESPDLGASVGPGEDFEEEDTRSDEEKEAALEAGKNEIPDPTRHMSQAEARDYWMRRSNHFESEYKGERSKRQAYDKQYGGLNSKGLRPEPEDNRAIDQYTNLSVPPGVDNLQDYTRFIVTKAKDEFRREMSEKQLDSRVETTEVKAREVHNGEDGLPAYDELIDEYVAPLIRKNKDIFNLLRQLDDPAEASYTLGFILKYKNFTEILKSQSRDELIKNINSTAKQAASVKGRSSGRQPSGHLTKADIDAMSVEDFEKELEKFRSGA